MTKAEIEQITLVSNVDSWSQEHNKYADNQFSRIYNSSKDTDNGWESVFKSSPSQFYRAYALALEYKDKAESAGFLDY